MCWEARDECDAIQREHNQMVHWERRCFLLVRTAYFFTYTYLCWLQSGIKRRDLGWLWRRRQRWTHGQVVRLGDMVLAARGVTRDGASLRLIAGDDLEDAGRSMRRGTGAVGRVDADVALCLQCKDTHIYTYHDAVRSQFPWETGSRVGILGIGSGDSHGTQSRVCGATHAHTHTRAHTHTHTHTHTHRPYLRAARCRRKGWRFRLPRRTRRRRCRT